MKKRKPSDFIRDKIRKKRTQYANKRAKETEAERQKRQEGYVLESNKEYPVNSGEDRMMYSKEYHNLKKTPCPNILSLEDDLDKLDETIQFLNRLPGADIPNKTLSRKLRRRFRKKSRLSRRVKSYFDFASVEQICPASALIISSCYFMHKQRGAAINIYDWEDWNDQVKSTLTKMGFFELLEFKLIPTDKNLQKIPIKGFKSGNSVVRKEIADYFERLVKGVNQEVFIDKESVPFNQTVSAIWEAVENSVRHAYPDNFPKDVRGRWWFGGILSQNKEEITLICYDKGISIPRHIKEVALKEEPHDWITAAIEKLKQTGKDDVGGNLDDKRLEFAMTHARTSTEEDGSGQGLSYISETINGFKEGELKIISRRGYASLIKNQQPVFKLLNTPIIGTLIIWKLRL